MNIIELINKIANIDITLEDIEYYAKGIKAKGVYISYNRIAKETGVTYL